jgi:hypothetical protein
VVESQLGTLHQPARMLQRKRRRPTPVKVVGDEDVAVAVETVLAVVVVNSTSTVRLARLTLTKRSINRGVAMMAMPN